MPVYRVKLFAALKDAAGADVYEWEGPESATVADLRRALSERFPAAGSLWKRSFVAVERVYAVDTRELRPDAEIAFIPPVSGGA